MINKQNLWFITLFSLILVLGIYYVSLSDEKLANLESNSYDNAVVNVEESNAVVALKVAEDENILKAMQEYQNILLDEKATIEEKNEAYNSLQELNSTKGEIEKIQKMITDTYKYDNCVKINGDAITITVSSKEHSTEIANKIIRSVQALYKNRKYISIKFEA